MATIPLWNPYGQFTTKTVFIHYSRCSGKKVTFTRWCRLPFLIRPSSGKCRHFCEGHGGSIFYKSCKEVKSVVKTYYGHGIEVPDPTKVVCTCWHGPCGRSSALASAWARTLLLASIARSRAWIVQGPIVFVVFIMPSNANITATTCSCRYTFHNIRRILPLLSQKAA